MLGGGERTCLDTATKRWHTATLSMAVTWETQVLLVPAEVRPREPQETTKLGISALQGSKEASGGAPASAQAPLLSAHALQGLHRPSRDCMLTAVFDTGPLQFVA